MNTLELTNIILNTVDDELREQLIEQLLEEHQKVQKSRLTLKIYIPRRISCHMN